MPNFGGCLIGGLNTKDYSILRPMLGSPYLGKLQYHWPLKFGGSSN